MNVVGIDIGGSKTHGVRVDDGRIVAGARVGSANATSMGIDEATRRLDVAVTGSARATDLAVVHGVEAALGAFLDSHAAVAADALDTVNSALPPELARRLLDDRAEEAERHRATAAAELEQTVADVRAGVQHHYLGLGLDELTRRLSRLSASL